MFEYFGVTTGRNVRLLALLIDGYFGLYTMHQVKYVPLSTLYRSVSNTSLVNGIHGLVPQGV